VADVTWTNGTDVSHAICWHVLASFVLLTGEFAGNLPDYQKVEIMTFVMSKISLSAAHR